MGHKSLRSKGLKQPQQKTLGLDLVSKSKLDQCCAIWVLCWTRIGAMLGSCWVIWWAILVEKKQSNLIVLFGGAAPEAQVELLNLPP